MIDFFSILSSFIKNPAQSLPMNALRDPKGAVQQLVQSGKMSQAQFNSLRQKAQEIMENPMFAQIVGK